MIKDKWDFYCMNAEACEAADAILSICVELIAAHMGGVVSESKIAREANNAMENLQTILSFCEEKNER